MDQYEELETIGTGAFGKVCKIRRKADDKVLVWKELNYGSMNEQEKQQLVTEVNILRELRNPFIVRYHDRIVDKKTTRLYIVMEYCAGGDLGKIIKKCKRDRTNLDEALIWKIFSQILVALKDCHRHMESGECRPILHRDLKPANIMLDQSENLKIGDFGLAKELSSGSKLAKTNVGTPYYMSPELINGKKYDERSDIWSVGCILYELAALRPPFDASNQLSLAMKINAGKFHRIPSKYSDDLNGAIRMMLQVDPHRRPRVEDLESLPTIQPSLKQANFLVKEAVFHQNCSSKLRELRSREEALQGWEEKLRQREEQLVIREKAFLAKEQRTNDQGAKVFVQKVAYLRTHSDSNCLERRTSTADDYRRMSITGADDDEVQPPQKQPPESKARDGDLPPPPFHIYCDAKEDKTPASNQLTRRDDFTSGVARARELLGRPRLMNRGSSAEYDSTAKNADTEKHSTFYRNYLNGRKTENMSENVDPSKQQHEWKVNRHEVSKNMRQPPAPPLHTRRRSSLENSGLSDANCGSATKRPRHEVYAEKPSVFQEERCDVSKEDIETTRKAEIVPAVHIDLHTFLANGKGKGKQEYL